ncbi:MAG: SDR family oxidoreductase [Acidobacteria bacterium]|nr:SDR family oxidoreductase [Acidobacteriota bacterium]
MDTQTAIVTGASSGIGRELARLFAADGYNLVVVARQREALESLIAGITRDHRVAARALAVDLADPEAGRRIEEDLARAGVLVDVLVNNAGFGLQGAFADLPLERQLAMIQVNVTTLTELTRRFLPGMLARNRGGILNVGSTAGFQPGPFMAGYYATKAYVVSLTEALAEEVAGSAVRVSCLAPGPTATRFAEAARMTETRLFRGGTMTAAAVARIGYDAWKRGKILAVPGVSNKLGVALVRVSPRPLVRTIVKRLNR